MLQVLGHAIERSGQSPDRVGASGRHPGFQAALGDLGGGRLQATQAPLQLAHQQVDDQADQAQAQCRDQHQPLRRIRVHLVQRADLQHPRRADHAGEDPDGVAALAQRHHRIALGHTAALVVVHVRLLGGHESQIETKTFFLRQLRQPFGLFGHRITHQLVGQQVNGRASQLFADLLDFPTNISCSASLISR